MPQLVFTTFLRGVLLQHLRSLKNILVKAPVIICDTLNKKASIWFLVQVSDILNRSYCFPNSNKKNKFYQSVHSLRSLRGYFIPVRVSPVEAEGLYLPSSSLKLQRTNFVLPILIPVIRWQLSFQDFVGFFLEFFEWPPRLENGVRTCEPPGAGRLFPHLVLEPSHNRRAGLCVCTHTSL